LYSRVVVRRVDVGQQLIRRTEPGHVGGSDVDHRQHLADVRRLEQAGVDAGAKPRRGRALVAGEQRFDAALGPNPGAVGARRALAYQRQQAGVEKWQVAGHHQHQIGAGDLERRVDRAQDTAARQTIGMHGESEIAISLGLCRDDEDLGGHPLQNFHLPYDDGATLDGKPALVPSAEATRLPSRNDRGGRLLTGHELIMTEARIGRLLAASLHQAIGDVLPQRLEFYEHWLNSEDLRGGHVGLAAMTAVVGFLRTEGESYNRVVARAGQLAAEWTLASMPGMRRRAVMWLPRPLRVRAAVRMAAEVMASIYSTTRTSSRVRRNQARVEVKSSIFCTVRSASPAPLCGFYVAVAIEVLRNYQIGATGKTERCQAVGGSSCVVALDLSGVVAAPDPAIAA